jgi:hypothetical protein
MQQETKREAALLAVALVKLVAVLVAAVILAVAFVAFIVHMVAEAVQMGGPIAAVIPFALFGVITVATILLQKRTDIGAIALSTGRDGDERVQELSRRASKVALAVLSYVTLMGVAVATFFPQVLPASPTEAVTMMLFSVFGATYAARFAAAWHYSRRH